MLLLLIVLNLCHEHTINFYIAWHIAQQVVDVGITGTIIIKGCFNMKLLKCFLDVL